MEWSFTKVVLGAVLAFSGYSCSPVSEDRCSEGDTPLSLISSHLEGRLLQLDVSYAGGCAEHEFSLRWSGVVATSDPPIVPLEIYHEGNGDSCEAAIQDHLLIDLRPIAEALQGGDFYVDLIDASGRLIDSIGLSTASASAIPPTSIPVIADDECVSFFLPRRSQE